MHMVRMLEVQRRYEPSQVLCFRVLDNALERLRGLLGTGADAQPVALVGCSSIHTFGMRYRIDVAFVDDGGLVLASWRSLPPGRVVSNRHAWIVLERPHACGPWFAKGEVLKMNRIDEDVPALSTVPGMPAANPAS